MYVYVHLCTCTCSVAHVSGCGLLCVSLQLGEAESHPEWVGFLLQQRQPQLLGMVVGGGSKEGEEEVGGETFLWTFLDLSLATPGE